MGRCPKDGPALCEVKTGNRLPVLVEEIKQAYGVGILYRWPPKPKQAAWLRSLVEWLGGRFDGKPVFTRCLPVAWWAARTVVEDGEQGPRIRLLRPTERPHSANSAPRVSDCPEDETLAYGPSVQGVV